MRYLITFIWGLMFVTASIIALNNIIQNYKTKEWYEFLLIIPIMLALDAILKINIMRPTLTSILGALCIIISIIIITILIQEKEYTPISVTSIGFLTAFVFLFSGIKLSNDN